MTAQVKALVSWSSGKDSAWTLHQLQQDRSVEVVGLLTTVTSKFDRVSMHGVRREVLEKQAEMAGLPLHCIEIPSPCSNTDYEKAMSAAMQNAKRDGITHIAFGDLFLEDIRQYRIEKLKGTGIEPLFPIWAGQDGTKHLAQKMLTAGLKTKVVTIDPRHLDSSFVGRDWDQAFLEDLPPTVDPCGENGEFHTCCYAGPMYQATLDLSLGEKVQKDGFWFADLLC